MGAGASMEDEAPPAGGMRPVSSAAASTSGHIVRQPSARGSARGSARASRTNSQMSLAWKNALKSASLSQTGMRKMRAAALGRKSACTVCINKTGFSLQHIQICEGQVRSQFAFERVESL